MARKTAEEIGGFEYDWIACDADGNVGFFSTAGGGYAPPEFSADTDVVDKAIEAIVTSPARTTARFAPNLPSGHTNTWRLMAERGVFAFDSDFNGGPYRLVAAPQVAAHFTDMPSAAVQVLRRTALRDLRLRAQAVIDAETLADASRP